MPCFSISVAFPTGRYHGEEWPPSPMRLYQALLAGVMTGGYRSRWNGLETAFAWLERQDPPEIVSTPASTCSSYRISVPNNDFDVAGREWSRGRPYDTARLRTMKTVSPRSLRSDGPHVHYLWQVAPGETQEAERLRDAVHCLHTLGWGIDMAYADAAVLDGESVERLQGARWRPADAGPAKFAVPLEGTLADLHRTYARYLKRATGKGVDVDTRPTVYALQGYRREGEVTRPRAEFALRTLDGRSSYARAWHESMLVAAWLRHAAAEALREEDQDADWIDRYVLGHQDNGDRNRRLSYVPLPSVGHPHSDGRIRRALIVAPPDDDGETISLLKIKLSTWKLTAEDGQEVCRLSPAEDRHTVWPFYLRRAHEWRTATPVVLHGYNTDRRRLSVAKTEKLLLQALTESGYPERMIEDFACQPAPFWAGCGGALQMRLPRHLDRWPRYHVAVRFREEVKGPVLAGIGRHYGIGLFAAG